MKQALVIVGVTAWYGFFIVSLIGFLRNEEKARDAWELRKKMSARWFLGERWSDFAVFRRDQRALAKSGLVFITLVYAGILYTRLRQ